MRFSYHKIAAVFMGLLLICLFTGYSLEASNFAEIHLAVPGLDFPVFIGEIVLILCGLLVVSMGPVRFLRLMTRPWPLFALGFGLWILVKALTGYAVYGPLALRHAAMFYYTVAAVLVFGSLETIGILREAPQADSARCFFIDLAGVLCFGVIVTVKLLAGIYLYFFLPYFILGLICLVCYRRMVLRIAALVCLAGVFPYNEFFHGGSSFILANAIASAGTLVTLAAVSVRAGRFWKFGLALGCMGLVAAGICLTAPRSESRPFVTPGVIWRHFENDDALVQSRKASYRPDLLPVKLYKNNHEAPVGTTTMHSAVFQSQTPQAQKVPETSFENPMAPERQAQGLPLDQPAQSGPVVTETMPQVLAQNAAPVNQRLPEHAAPDYETKICEISYDNIVFRMFIWRDMVSELLRRRAVDGMPLGYPLRSPSLEILQRGKSEWARDGWIEPHNSYLNFIYRGGIAGLMMVVMMGFWQIRFWRFFAVQRSLVGILLSAGLLYWNILACFMVLYELPYTAIPAWMWWGLTAFYYRRLKTTEGP